jgi:hypothetical protein
MDVGSSAALLPAIVAALMRHPERGEALYSLSAGGAFAGPPPSGEAATRVDVPRIDAIRLGNAFALGAVTPSHDQGSGLFVRPSLFNHSRAPCCTWHVVADFMFVRTSRAVLAGEELTLPYLDVRLPLAQRTAKLAAWGGSSGGGFTCDCARCVEEREQKVVKQAKKAAGKPPPLKKGGRSQQAPKAWEFIRSNKKNEDA